MRSSNRVAPVNFDGVFLKMPAVSFPATTGADGFCPSISPENGPIPATYRYEQTSQLTCLPRRVHLRLPEQLLDGLVAYHPTQRRDEVIEPEI